MAAKEEYIVLIGNEQLNTLLDLRYRKYVKAEHGKDGHTSGKQGVMAKAGFWKFRWGPLSTMLTQKSAWVK